LSRSEWDDAISKIATDDSISEVIYSGGDPLASNDKQLLWLTQQIAAIPHIKRLRIHTRLPVVIPNRITDASLEWMTNHRLATVVVLHMNHANELNDETLRHSIQMMKNAGITVLNQAVLLKGINDSVEDLAQLSEASFDAGVIPYYLHVLDKVDGSAHFDIADNEAKKLHQQLTHYLPGYLVPKLVREMANMPAKVAI
jgi:KamA family protein